MIYTKKSGLPIATDYVRVVHGGRGDYVEFTSEQMIRDYVSVPPEQRWRIDDPIWKDRVYYTWYQTQDGVKIYNQKKTVTYADYKVGMLYIAPVDLQELPIKA